MKIKIELENPKYCYGCPFLYGLDSRYFYCRLKYKLKDVLFSFREDVVRPKKCIKENGE